MCDAVFDCESVLETHKDLHRNSMEYACDLCDHKCTSNDELNQHKDTHKQTTGRDSVTPSADDISVDTNNVADITAKENLDLKRRLGKLWQDYEYVSKATAENKDKAIAFKIEIEAATESYRVMKVENEKLKETQHKL